jgi:hypothetical protein
VTCQHGGSGTPARQAGSPITRFLPVRVLVHKRTDPHIASCQGRYTPRRPDCGANHMLLIVGVVIALIAVITPRMRVPGGVNSASPGWMSEQSRRAYCKRPVELWSRIRSSGRRHEMGLVFHRRLAIPLWTIAFFTVALTVPPPATLFLMPPTTLLVVAVLGIAAILFTMPAVVPWLRTSRSVIGAVPSRHRQKTSVAVTMVAGTCVRALGEPNESTADDALDLVRMDDDGGWQIARPPA